MEPVIMTLEGAPIDGASVFGAMLATMAGVIIAFIVLMIFMIIVNWKFFEKAGFKGYESLIPGHNFVVMIQIAGKPISYFFLMLIPFANIIFMIKMINGISKSFGKGTGFTWGLLFLPFIFLPILVWGDSVYAATAEAACELPSAEEPVAQEEAMVSEETEEHDEIQMEEVPAGKASEPSIEIVEPTEEAEKEVPAETVSTEPVPPVVPPTV